MESCQAEIGEASADGGRDQGCCVSDHSMNKMFFEQLGERTIPRFFSRTHRREKFGGLRNRPRMPGAVNLPPPWVRRLAPAFNHYREIGLLVIYEAHAIEYKTTRNGSRINPYCQTCQLTEVSSPLYKRLGSVGRSGPELVSPTFWSGPRATPRPWLHISSLCEQGAEGTNRSSLGRR